MVRLFLFTRERVAPSNWRLAKRGGSSWQEIKPCDAKNPAGQVRGICLQAGSSCESDQKL
jgi:hypothetical protein